jgi:hypothetical protein
MTSFWGAYLIALIFHVIISLAITVAIGKRILPIYIEEGLGAQLFDSRLALCLSKILFHFSMMLIFPVSLEVYLCLSDRFQALTLVQSGMFTVIWLILCGMLVTTLYYLITHRKGTFRDYDLVRDTKQFEFLWAMCPIIFAYLFSTIIDSPNMDEKLFSTVVAIVLGKYIWMDFLTFNIFEITKDKIERFLISFTIKRFRLYRKNCLDIILLISTIVLVAIYYFHSVYVFIIAAIVIQFFIGLAVRKFMLIIE